MVMVVMVVVVVVVVVMVLIEDKLKIIIKPFLFPH